MKMKYAVLVALVVVLCGFQAFAAKGSGGGNKVTVTGDIQKGGNLFIDLDWTVDSAKYPGLPTDNIREQVREEMWNAMLPKLVAKTQGMPVSFSKDNFTKLSENHTLVEKRHDGTSVHNVQVKVRFDFPQSATPPPVLSKADTQKKIDDEYHYHFVKQF